MALFVLGPERMLTPSVAVIWVSAAAGAALTAPSNRMAASSVTTAILSRDARALNSFSFEHHLKFPEQTRSVSAVTPVTEVTKTSTSAGL